MAFDLNALSLIISFHSKLLVNQAYFRNIIGCVQSAFIYNTLFMHEVINKLRIMKDKKDWARLKLDLKELIIK